MLLYHGINNKDISLILENGLNSYSYWGTIDEALKYSDCSKVISLDTDIHAVSILPNDTLISHAKENDLDSYHDWLDSKMTWEDSLKIFGSVIIEENVSVEDEDIKIIN